MLILSSFTADPLVPHLHFWLTELGYDEPVARLPNDQVMPQVLDPTSPFNRANDTMRCIVVRANRWPSSVLRELAEQIESVPGRRTGLLFAPRRATSYALDQLELEIAERLAGLPHVRVTTAATVTRRYGRHHDAWSDELSQMPYTLEGYAALATELVRMFDAMYRRPFKLVASDGDDTLWGGALDEVGAEGLRLDGRPARLRRRLAEGIDGGLLAALVSTGDLDRAREAFESLELGLGWDQLTAAQVHRGRKSTSLERMSAELGLALDDMLFIDDDEREIAEIRAAHPEVSTIHLGPSLEARHVDHLWPLDVGGTTEADRRRGRRYRDESSRRHCAAAYKSYEEFLASLRLRLTWSDARSDPARVQQLEARTNQFTLGGESPDLEDPRVEWQLVAASDRFGDYGTVSLVGTRVIGPVLRVCGWYLSGRALGRGVEQAILDRLTRSARERGCDRLRFALRDTGSRTPIAHLLRSIGATDSPDSSEPTVTLDAIRPLRPRRHAPRSFPEHAAAPARPDYGAIARLAANPARVVQRTSQWKRVARIRDAITAMLPASTRMDAPFSEQGLDLRSARALRQRLPALRAEALGIGTLIRMTPTELISLLATG